MSMIQRVNQRRAAWRDRRVPAKQLPSIDQVVREHIERVLEATDGNAAHAAEILGIDRRTLYSKLDRYAAEQAEAR